MICYCGNRDGCSTGLCTGHGVESRRSDGDSGVVAEWRPLTVECVWISAPLFPRRPTWVGVVKMSFDVIVGVI